MMARPMTNGGVMIGSTLITRSTPLKRNAVRAAISAKARPSTVEPAPSARWSNAARARLTMSHRSATAATPLPASTGRAIYARCEDRIGAATAIDGHRRQQGEGDVDRPTGTRAPVSSL